MIQCSSALSPSLSHSSLTLLWPVCKPNKYKRSVASVQHLLLNEENYAEKVLQNLTLSNISVSSLLFGIVENDIALILCCTELVRSQEWEGGDSEESQVVLTNWVASAGRVYSPPHHSPVYIVYSLCLTEIVVIWFSIGFKKSFVVFILCYF